VVDKRELVALLAAAVALLCGLNGVWLEGFAFADSGAGGGSDVSVANAWQGSGGGWRFACGCCDDWLGWRATEVGGGVEEGLKLMQQGLDVLRHVVARI
jgi:hypothetical protein